MGVDSLIDMVRAAVMIALTIMSPLLLLGLLVGLLMGMLQTVTNVHDPTISLIPRMIAMLIVLLVCLPWLACRMLEYSQVMFSHSYFTGGG